MSAAIPLVVHSIHDASLRADIGGNDLIAVALNGLLATDSYNEQVQRTVVAGTLAGAVDTLRRDGALSLLYSARLGIFAGVTERERSSWQICCGSRAPRPTIAAMRPLPLLLALAESELDLLRLKLP